MNNDLVSIMHGAQSEVADTLLDGYFLKTYDIALGDLEFTNFKGLSEHLTKAGFSIFNFKSSMGAENYMFEKSDRADGKGDICFYIIKYKNEDYLVDIYSKDKDSLQAIYKDVSLFLKKDDDIYISLSSFFIERGLDQNISTIVKKDFEKISADYYPDILDMDGFINSFLQGDESIFILNGETGLGKTKFFALVLQHILNNPEILGRENDSYINIGYLKDEKVLALDQFWTTLKDREFDLLILDDLDYYLESRTATISSEDDVNKNKFISQLLSFSDGLVKNKTKFLISTNKDISHIDTALQRPGRLFGIFNFNKLTKEEAKQIWIKAELTEETFEDEFGKEKFILQASLGSMISKYKKSNGKKPKSFLREGSTIKINTFDLDSSTKMGFKTS